MSTFDVDRIRAVHEALRDVAPLTEEMIEATCEAVHMRLGGSTRLAERVIRRLFLDVEALRHGPARTAGAGVRHGGARR